MEVIDRGAQLVVNLTHSSDLNKVKHIIYQHLNKQ